jgi:hypothetical protein
LMAGDDRDPSTLKEKSPWRSSPRKK